MKDKLITRERKRFSLRIYWTSDEGQERAAQLREQMRGKPFPVKGQKRGAIAANLTSQKPTERGATTETAKRLEGE